MAIALLDTSVVIGYLDANDALHGKAVPLVQQVKGNFGLELSMVSYSELLVGAHRSGQETVTKLDNIIDSLFTLVPITREIAGRGAELRASYPDLKLPDALIIATGLQQGASQIITGDAAWQKVDPSVRVI